MNYSFYAIETFSYSIIRNYTFFYCLEIGTVAGKLRIFSFSEKKLTGIMNKLCKYYNDVTFDNKERSRIHLLTLQKNQENIADAIHLEKNKS